MVLSDIEEKLLNDKYSLCFSKKFIISIKSFIVCSLSNFFLESIILPSSLKDLNINLLTGWTEYETIPIGDGSLIHYKKLNK